MLLPFAITFLASASPSCLREDQCSQVGAYICLYKGWSYYPLYATVFIISCALFLLTILCLSGLLRPRKAYKVNINVVIPNRGLKKTIGTHQIEGNNNQVRFFPGSDGIVILFFATMFPSFLGGIGDINLASGS